MFIILFLVISNVFAFDLKKTDFETFTNYVSYSINKNIIISDSVDTKFSIFMPSDSMSKKEILNYYLRILNLKNLSYKITRDTILVYKPKDPTLKTYVIKYNYIPKEKLSSFLKSLYPDLKFFIFQDRVVFSSTYANYLNIKQVLYSLQRSYLTSVVNFNIVVINNKKLKKVGTELNLPFQSKNLLLSLSSSTFNIVPTYPGDLGIVLNLLYQKGVSESISKPSLKLIDGNNYTLESVNKIPYITKTIKYSRDGTPYTETDLKYKDVGLRIYIKNVNISEKSVNFDLDIFIENLVSIENNIPITDLKHLTTHVELTKKHSHYLLSGLRSVTKINSKEGIPYLSKIPFLGFLFQNDESSVQDFSFALIVSTDYFNTQNKPTPEERP